MSNGLDWGRLPIFDKEVDQGNYSLNFSSPGYENLTRNYRVSLGQQINQQINLRPKTRNRALLRSLLFPGLGQYYSADKDHGGRKVAGLIYATSAVICIAGSGYIWNEFVAANNAYEEAKNNYLQATLLTDIDNGRLDMEKKHQISKDAQSTAFSITGITIGLWLWSTIDATLFFPNDYTTFSVTPNINTNGQETFANITISKKF